MHCKETMCKHKVRVGDKGPRQLGGVKARQNTEACLKSLGV